MENLKIKRGLVWACLLLPWFLYMGTLPYPFFFDDFANIVYNPDIKNWQLLISKLVYKSGYGMGQNDPSRPITFLTYAFNYSLGGLSPIGYRIGNILLHSIVTLLIFVLTRRILKTILLSAAVALLFSCHPIQCEVVSYVSGRADGLATLFYLLSLFLFVKFTEDFPNRFAWGVFSIASFALSFWSKPIGATFPLVVLLFDLFFYPREGFKKRKWIHAAYWALLALFLLFRVFYLGGLGDRVTDPFSEWTRKSYLLIQPYSILKYIQLLLFPIGQSVDHFAAPSRGLMDPRTLLGLGALGVLTFLTTLIGIKFPGYKKQIWFSYLWFFITLLPTSSFFPIQDALTERRLYLPSFGFFLILAMGIEFFFSTEKRRILFTISALFILSSLTWKRSQIFSNPMDPWKEAVLLYPQNPRAQYNLGNEYLWIRNNTQAKQHYLEALRLKPTLAEPHNNLGLIYLMEGNSSEALNQFEKAVQLNPNFQNAQSNLMKIRQQLKSRFAPSRS